MFDILFIFSFSGIEMRYAGKEKCLKIRDKILSCFYIYRYILGYFF